MAEERALSEDRRWYLEREVDTLNSDKETIIGVINTDVTAQWLILTLVAAIETVGIPVLQNLQVGGALFIIGALFEILLGVFWWGVTNRLQRGVDIRRMTVKDIEIRLREIVAGMDTLAFTRPELLALEMSKIRSRHYILLLIGTFMLLWIFMLGRGIYNLPQLSRLSILLATMVLLMLGIVAVLIWSIRKTSAS